ncbi:MAG: glycosyltransferase family 1 protein, partial [Alcaligenaceae bacterium]
MKFLLIASLGESLINFRGSLIGALQARGFQVHVAAPDLPAFSEARQRLEVRNVVVHEVPLSRTGMNPAADIRTLWSLWRLMRRVRPEWVLGYTIK